MHGPACVGYSNAVYWYDCESVLREKKKKKKKKNNNNNNNNKEKQKEKD